MNNKTSMIVACAALAAGIVALVLGAVAIGKVNGLRVETIEGFGKQKQINGSNIELHELHTNNTKKITEILQKRR